MRYITISADYDSTGIKDLNDGELDKEDLKVSSELWDDLKSWVHKYEPIIQMDKEQRQANIDLINQLDLRGIHLCKRFLTELKEQAKIEYFSEGLLKKINF